MHSPTKNTSYLNKKATRKNTFSQATITQSEVGDFQGGYFVMDTAVKENAFKPKNNNKLERSPVRRKQPHHTNETTAPSSPTKERNAKLDQPDFKKPLPLDIKKHNTKGELLLTPGSFSASSTKLASPSPKQVHPAQYELSCPPTTPNKSTSVPSSPSKDCLPSSPPGSGRWAGPAFGNAPHPSTLPLPEWTSDPLSASPPVHDGGSYLGTVYQQSHPVIVPTSPTHFLPQSPTSHLSTIPVIPFPYVGSHVPMPAVLAPSLAQLSTDLRRMLNINGSVPVPVMSDPIMVSANSS